MDSMTSNVSGNVTYLPTALTPADSWDRVLTLFRARLNGDVFNLTGKGGLGLVALRGTKVVMDINTPSRLDRVKTLYKDELLACWQLVVPEVLTVEIVERKLGGDAIGYDPTLRPLPPKKTSRIPVPPAPSKPAKSDWGHLPPVLAGKLPTDRRIRILVSEVIKLHPKIPIVRLLSAPKSTLTESQRRMVFVACKLAPDLTLAQLSVQLAGLSEKVIRAGIEETARKLDGSRFGFADYLKVLERECSVRILDKTDNPELEHLLEPVH